MESNLSFFSLPFIDNGDIDFSKIKGECDFDDLHPTLPSHGSLLGTDDVLAQFLSGDELLEEPDLNGPTTLHCEICRKQFDNAKKYYGHLRVHSKDNLWICDKCPNEKFSTKQQLMKHSLTHKPLERVWRCPQCDMAFEALWRLQQHLFAKHLDYRPHKCDRCEMSFHKLSDLKKHTDIHDDALKHACKVCKVRFNDASNLKRHMNSHGNKKPYPCSGCGNRFTQLASMKRHSKNCALVKQDPTPMDKSLRKNYCRVCGMTFQYKSALLEHCVRQHSNNPPPPNETPKENKSNELHVDTNPTININKTSSINIESTRHINVNSTNTSQIDTTTHTVNIENNLVNLTTNHCLNINTNQIVSITSHSMNLHSNPPLNLNANPPLSINVNPVSINTNSTTTIPVNVQTNLPSNLHANPSVNLNSNPVHINAVNIDHNRTVDNIVDDILSAEDDYLNRNPMSNQMLNYNPAETEHHDTLINQIELLKEMNHMHILDDELLCNDLDFDSFQTMCNTNDMDYTDKNELLFDITDGRSMDQDIMNALYQVKGDNLPDLLNEPEILNTTEKVNDFLVNPTVSVNECATIFESDVDLEASTNLAANLNQLIGENSVQYISTEHDDTFIIRLNSEIDAEQLTDMLNIGVGTTEEINKTVEASNEERDFKEPAPVPIVVTIENLPQANSMSSSSNQTITQPISVQIKPIVENENKEVAVNQETSKAVKTKKRTLYVCRKCNKIFKKKNNYKSHRATHEPSLRQYGCRVCGERFSYRSTLNKHTRKLHTPLVAPAHPCTTCDKSYKAAWMLKRHVARDHDFILPFKCKEKDCGRRFYKQSDLNVHNRFHTDERRHKCEICNRGFHVMSHLKRHIRTVDCTKLAKQEDITKSNMGTKIPLGSLLIINQQ